MNARRKTAELFGYYLDNDRFDELKELIDGDCEYILGVNNILRGMTAIADSYRLNMEDGRRKFDVLEWGKCRIEELDEQNFDVCFSDYLKHKGIEHTYRCKQRISVNASNLITSIEHMEYPGEREKLVEFKRSVGL